jgi:simple sugar transport system permease protein
MPKSLAIPAATLGLALVVILVVIAAAGASPVAVIGSIMVGAFGTGDRWVRIVTTFVPLLLCTIGLLFTFTAGLYNLGIEGQMVAGVIATLLPIYGLQDRLPAGVVIGLALLAGTGGGLLWGLLAGWLKVVGRINFSQNGRRGAELEVPLLFWERDLG